MKIPKKYKHLQDSVDFVDRIVKDVKTKYNISESKARELVDRTADYDIHSEADVHYLIKKWL